MNPDTPFTTIGDEPVEARIVAWVLGEASAFEAAELERLCDERPELMIFKRRMLALHGLLAEAENPQADDAWKLRLDKRKPVEEIFGEETPVRLELVKEKRIGRSGRRAFLAIAACVLFTLVITQIQPWKQTSEAIIEVKPRAVGMSPLGGDMGESSGSARMSPQFFGTESEKIKSRKSLEKVVDNLDLTDRWGMDKEQAVAKLKNSIKTEKVDGTDMLKIQVRRSDKKEADEITREVAYAYKDYREQIEKQAAERQLAELNNAVQDQEDKVEERRKVLAVIDRTKQARAEGRLAANDVREDAIKRGLDSQDYVDARREFEADQELLQTMKLKQMGETISRKAPSDSVVIHEVPEAGAKSARVARETLASNTPARTQRLETTLPKELIEGTPRPMNVPNLEMPADGPAGSATWRMAKANRTSSTPAKPSSSVAKVTTAAGARTVPVPVDSSNPGASSAVDPFAASDGFSDESQTVAQDRGLEPREPRPRVSPGEPVIPSYSLSRAGAGGLDITSGTSTPVPEAASLPQPDVSIDTPTTEFGDRADFGSSWGSGGGAPAAGESAPAFTADNRSGAITAGNRSGYDIVEEKSIDGILNTTGSIEDESASFAGKTAQQEGDARVAGDMPLLGRLFSDDEKNELPADSRIAQNDTLSRANTYFGEGGFSKLAPAPAAGAERDASAPVDAKGPVGAVAGQPRPARGVITEEVRYKIDESDKQPAPEFKDTDYWDTSEAVVKGKKAGKEYEINTGYKAEYLFRGIDLGKDHHDGSDKATDEQNLQLPRITTRSALAPHKAIAGAQELRKAGKYDEAQKILEDTLADNPANQEVREEIAKLDDPIRSNPALTHDRTRSQLLSEAEKSWETEVPKQQANLDVIREFQYPTEYEPPELPDIAGQAAAFPQTPASPAFLRSQTETSQEKTPKLNLAKLMEEISTSEEPYSTFSLNISDASFRVAQAAMDKGERPDPAGIKVEQFYNAVDYGDPSPAAGEPVACAIEQAAHPVIPGRNLVRVAVKTAAAGRAASQPLHLTLLVDQSGSMTRADRRAAMDAAMAGLGKLLTEKDIVNIVGFSRTPRLLADGMKGDEAGKKLAELVNQSASEGGTNLETAIDLAGQMAQRRMMDGAQNRIVLLTDGATNLGDADPQRLAAKVGRLRQQGIALDIAGIAADGLNDELLGELARKGNGRYHVVGKGAEEDFAKQLAGAFRPAAENVKVQVRFNPERVARYKLIGFEKDRLKTEDFRNDKVDAAELAAEEAGVAIYQIEPIPDGSGELGEVSVRFRDTASGDMVERGWTMPHDAAAPAIDRATPSMQLATLAMFAAEKLKGGPLGEAIDFKQLAEPAANAKQFYGSNARVAEVLRMVDALK